MLHSVRVVRSSCLQHVASKKAVKYIVLINKYSSISISITPMAIKRSSSRMNTKTFGKVEMLSSGGYIFSLQSLRIYHHAILEVGQTRVYIFDIFSSIFTCNGYMHFFFCFLFDLFAHDNLSQYTIFLFYCFHNLITRGDITFFFISLVNEIYCHLYCEFFSLFKYFLNNLTDR